MEFDRNLKGKITESIVQTLLEHAGYRVVPLGIEHVLREIKQNTSLRLPKQLRALPDFLITDAEISRSWFLEVKYRHQWNETTIKSLQDVLTPQVHFWDDFYCLVFLGNSYDGKVRGSSRLGIFHVTNRDGSLGYLNKGNFYPWKNAKWQFSTRVHDVFENLKESQELQIVNKCCEIVDKFSDILVS